MTPTIASAIRKFLHYSFADVNYDYNLLTPAEKRLVTPEDFAALVRWLREEEVMQKGDALNIPDYELVATAQVVEGGGPPYRGEVVVVHNHSTHYLVAWREPGANRAYVEQWFRYGEDVAPAYRLALNLMTTLALEN